MTSSSFSLNLDIRYESGFHILCFITCVWMKIEMLNFSILFVVAYLVLVRLLLLRLGLQPHFAQFQLLSLGWGGASRGSGKSVDKKNSRPLQVKLIFWQDFGLFRCSEQHYKFPEIAFTENKTKFRPLSRISSVFCFSNDIWNVEVEFYWTFHLNCDWKSQRSLGTKTKKKRLH